MEQADLRPVNWSQHILQRRQTTNLVTQITLHVVFVREQLMEIIVPVGVAFKITFIAHVLEVDVAENIKYTDTRE